MKQPPKNQKAVHPGDLRYTVRKIMGTAGVYALLTGFGALFLMPVLFMIAGSLKPDDQVLAEGATVKALVPVHFTLENYIAVFEQLQFGHFLFNSLLIVGSIVVAGLFVNSMAGYALSRLRWRGRNLFLTLVVAILVIPYEAVAVPLFFEMTMLGWTNSFRVQIVPFIANPFAIYLFYTFFNALPRELDEVARLDGAGPLRTFIHVIMPLSKPAYASVAILTFLLHWGFFLWPLMVTRGPQYQPLPVALGYFSANKPVQWGDIMAFGTLMIVPVLIVFLLFQRWFVRGIAMSGIKG